MIALVGVSAILRVSSLTGGLIVGAAAVWLARVVPPRMELTVRERPLWWWAAAVAGSALFGWLVAPLVDGPLVPAFLVFAGTTMALALVDLDHQLLPNRLLFPSVGVGAAVLAAGALAVGGAGDELLRALLGGVAYFGVLLVVAVAARGGFGMGDVKLALLLGIFLAYLGWGQLAVGFAVAILSGGAVAVALLIFTKRGRDAKFAYGPYLVAGAWVAILWGQEITDWYLGRS